MWRSRLSNKCVKSSPLNSPTDETSRSSHGIVNLAHNAWGLPREAARNAASTVLRRSPRPVAMFSHCLPTRATFSATRLAGWRRLIALLLLLLLLLLRLVLIISRLAQFTGRHFWLWAPHNRSGRTQAPDADPEGAFRWLARAPVRRLELKPEPEPEPSSVSSFQSSARLCAVANYHLVSLGL